MPSPQVQPWRRKAGTVLVREYRGERHTVSVVPDGFVCAKQICLFGPLELIALCLAWWRRWRAKSAVRNQVGMGLAARASRGGEDHPWDRMFGEAHPLDCVEGQPRSK